MDKKDFINQLTTAAGSGTLLTPKHDPTNLTVTYSNYRSVLSTDLANNLDSFITSGKYTVTGYYRKSYPASPYYMVIEPDPSSGVAAHSPNPSVPLDRLVTVSGTLQGWHIMGEDYATIIRKVREGDLEIVGVLT